MVNKPIKTSLWRNNTFFVCWKDPQTLLKFIVSSKMAEPGSTQEEIVCANCHVGYGEFWAIYRGQF